MLHSEILEGLLGISPEAVRDEHYIKYVRGMENATNMVADGEAQVAFLLEATTVTQVAETSFAAAACHRSRLISIPKL